MSYFISIPTVLYCKAAHTHTKKSRTTPKQLSKKASLHLTAFAAGLMCSCFPADLLHQEKATLWFECPGSEVAHCAALHPSAIPQGLHWGITPQFRCLPPVLQLMDIPARLLFDTLPYSGQVFSKPWKLFQTIKILIRAWTHIQTSQFLSHCSQY